MKKILLLMLSLIIAVTLIVSCDIFGTSTGDNDFTSTLDGVVIESTKPSDGSLIWNGSVKYAIVVDDETLEVTKLFRYLNDLTLNAPDVINSIDDKHTSYILFGEYDNPASKAAYAKLDRFADIYALAEKGESAFLIYAMDGNLAVAYNGTLARYAAIDYIMSYIKAPEFYANGIIAARKFNTAEFVAENRELEREVQFAAMEEYLGKDNVDALRRFYNLYDEDIYLLLANLYDPAIGGFYYSSSARDTEGFLPDLESTGQVLAFLDNSGLTASYRNEKLDYILGEYRSWANMLSDETKAQILDFAIGLQKSDGYFYHPQWATVGTSRLGRDAGWAKTIITVLGGKPNYPYISDTGTNSTASSGTSIVVPLGYYRDITPSKVVTVAAAELESEAAWIEYLNNANVSTNSYSVFNNLSARTSEIKKAGLWDATLTWLEANQYDNGTWEPTVSYNAINGVMKVSAFWSSSRPFPKAAAAVKSTLEIMRLDKIEDVTGITFVYNPWVVLHNVLSYAGAEEASLRAEVISNADIYIDGTFEKLAAFMQNDGGFSYNQDSSAHFSQEAYVAVQGTAESDVNATGIAVSTLVKYMMPVLLHGTGLEAPKVYGRYDAVYFIETLESLQAVIKKPYDGPEPSTETFDDFDSTEGGVANGVTLYPGPTVDINLNSDKVDTEGEYLFFNSSIVSNPQGAATDLVLYMKSKVYDKDGNGKIDDNGIECANKNEGSANAQFNIVNSTIVGNCYVFETDFLFEDYFGTGSTTAMQLMFSNGASYNPNNSVWFNFTTGRDDSGNAYLLMAENFAGKDGVKNTNLVGAIPAGQWIKLRIEMYKVFETDGKLSVKAKIFINDNFVCESDSSNYNTAEENYYDYVVNCVRFSCFRSGGASMYLDNCYAAKLAQDYVAESVDDSKIDTVVKAPAKYDFQTTVTEGIYSENYSTQSADTNRITFEQTTVTFGQNAYGGYGMEFSLDSDPENSANWVLKLNSKNAGSATAGRIDIDTEKVAGKRVHILEFDYYYDYNTAATANILQLDLIDVNGLKMGGSSTIIYNRVKGDASKSGVEAARISGNSAGYRINAHQWYRLRIVIDSDNMAIHYHVSLDEGKTWYVATAPGVISTGATIGTLRLICNTYNNTGVQYIDDIDYTISDAVPAAEVIKNEMADAAQPTTKVTYDFDTAVFPDNTVNFKATSNLKPDASGGAISYIAGSADYNAALATMGKDGSDVLLSGYGTAFYIVNDPTGGANKVLQAVTRNCSGADSYIDVLASKLTDNVTTLEITFDYYTDYNKYIAKDLPTMRLMLWDGQYAPDDVAAERRLSFFAHPSKTYVGALYDFDASAVEGKETQKVDNAFKVSDTFFSSHTWYTFKVIITGGKQYTYVAERGGEFELINTASYTAELANLKFMRIHIPSYNNNTRQYYDNISYVMTDTYVDPTK